MNAEPPLPRAALEAASDTPPGWSRSDWIAIAAHALSHRWSHIPPAQLDDVASELFGDGALRRLSPVDAVARWLAPVVVTACEAAPRDDSGWGQRAA